MHQLDKLLSEKFYLLMRQEKKYYNLVKHVLIENPSLTHGFPMTDFMQAFFKELSKQLAHSHDEQQRPGRFGR